MKRILVVLIALIGFSFSVNAQTFRFSGCNADKQRVEFYTDGSCVFIDSDGERLEGTYTCTTSRQDDWSSNVRQVTMNINYPRQTLRFDASGINLRDNNEDKIANASTTATLTVEGEVFRYCQ